MSCSSMQWLRCMWFILCCSPLSLVSAASGTWFGLLRCSHLSVMQLPTLMPYACWKHFGKLFQDVSTELKSFLSFSTVPDHNLTSWWYIPIPHVLSFNSIYIICWKWLRFGPKTEPCNLAQKILFRVIVNLDRVYPTPNPIARTPTHWFRPNLIPTHLLFNC